MENTIILTESDLTRIVKRVIMEQKTPPPSMAQTTIKSKTITPSIEIDCAKRVIVSSDLPKLNNESNLTIINHYCNK